MRWGGGFARRRGGGSRGLRDRHGRGHRGELQAARQIEHPLKQHDLIGDSLRFERDVDKVPLADGNLSTDRVGQAHVWTAGSYVCSVSPNVQATAPFALVIVGGTRSM